MKKLFTLVLLGLVFLLFSTSLAFSWGSATHAYIADHIGKFLPLMNANEMYGIMAPDIFNYIFTLTPDQMAAIQYYTHGSPGAEGFMKVWREASWWGYQRNLAYGYVAHNDVWGIDYTAHWASRTLNPAEGYVITKAKELLAFLIPINGSNVLFSDILSQAGLTDPLAQLELAHNLVETAGDIILAQADRFIGEKMIGAALARSNDFPDLLVRVMGRGWRDIIYAAEKEFRKSMILYGGALIQSQETAIKNMSDQMAQLGVEYVKAITNGQVIIPLDKAKQLAEAGIRASVAICAGDYMKEVGATIEFVKNNLKNKLGWY